MRAGLVSVSFRNLSVQEIIELCQQCKLQEIEWGGDIHVPLGCIETAKEVAKLTQAAGLHVACYGSYIRMTREERVHFPALVNTCRALGAPSIRVWAGRSEDADMDEIAESTQQLCDLAKDLIVTFEFHGGTLTHCADSACELMRRINRPNARSQWQTPLHLSENDCLASLSQIKPWLYNIHAFSWEGTQRLPLSMHEASWKKYLEDAAGDRAVLLEFVQDDLPLNLIRDAETLCKWLEEINV